MQSLAVEVLSQPCTVCGQTTSLWCSRCQNAWYCSPEHLRSDWPRHREECVPAEQASTSSNTNVIARPLSQEYTMASAILFLPYEERPTFVLVTCQLNKDPSQICPTPNVDLYFQHEEPQSIVLTQGLSNENLRFPLQLWYSPTALARGSPVNRAITHIASEAAKPWAGPVVVLKYSGSRRQGYTDAGSKELPHLAAYFLSLR